MPELSFYIQFPALVLLFLILAGIDFIRNHAKARKWQEYVFLLFCAMAGGLFGIINDMITSSISPEYFVFGKGIRQGCISRSNDFALKVVELGFQAGFFAGAIVGCTLLFANNPSRKSQPIPHSDIFAISLRPLFIAIIVAPLVSLLFSSDIFNLTQTLRGEVPSHKISNFLTVWGIHCGLYIGGTLGTIWSVTTILKRRKEITLVSVVR